MTAPIPNNSQGSPEANDDRGWIDDIVPNLEQSPETKRQGVDPHSPIVMVETAFLASAAGLLWLVNFYFPLGPMLLFFPLPIAIIYLRWGNRAAGMGVLVSTLLLSVLMGPVRAIQFLMPYGVLGWTFGSLWFRRSRWSFAIFIGTVLTTFGTFFRIWLVSILLGDDLWLYATIQVTGFVEWIFNVLGILQQPSLNLVQGLTVTAIVIKNILYVGLVHVVAYILCNRLGNPIPDPPKWIQVLMDE
ncbi:DUF2232 domain-containing protein [Alkalinema pantanalense CENA528]|uniref:DUF2232 domain-containing protein n=1 Tax=Alkalinema pantanalense TaxID=1620705 RepID=UPI003D6F80BF